MRREWDVVVVGAGPAGSSTAANLAKLGLKVALLEKRQEVGVPKRCGEGLSLNSMEMIEKNLGVRIPPKCIAQQIDGAVCYAPNGKKVVIDFKEDAGAVMERKVFDKWLAIQASNSGAYIQAKTNVTDIIKEKGFVTGVKANFEGKNYNIKSKVVVAADGVESTIARKAGLDTTNKLINIDSGYQYEMSNLKNFDERKIHLWFGNEVAPRGYCLTGDSLVLTRDSMKPIEEIREGEEVHNLLGWTKVAATSTRNYKGNIVKIIPSMFNAEVKMTEDHLVYVWNKKQGFTWKAAKDLIRGSRGKHGNGDYLIFPIPFEETVSCINISEYSDGIIDGEYLYPIGKNQFGAVFKYKHKIMNNLSLTPDLMELFGYFVSEGNVNSNGIIISNTNKEIINRVAKIGRDIFGFESSFWSNKREKECIQVNFSSKILKKTFKKLFGEGCQNKRIPRWFLGLSEELKRAFLIGLFRGDGSKEKSSEDNYDILSYISTSKQLIYDLWLLLASMGIVAAISYNKKKNAMRLRIRGKQLQKLTDVFGVLQHGNTFNRGFFIKDNVIFMNIRKLETGYFEGKVFDIESGGSFCPGFIVHNCWIFPKGSGVANVGIGVAMCDKPASYYLDKFIENNPEIFGNASIIEVNSGGIPVGGFLDNMVLDGLVAVGDAAHQVNPIHGGGMKEATIAGKIAGEVIANCIAKGDVSQKALSEYNKRWWSERGKKLKNVEKLRQVVEKLSDDDLNMLADNLKGEDLIELGRGNKLATLAKILMRKPKLIALAKHLL